MTPLIILLVDDEAHDSLKAKGDKKSAPTPPELRKGLQTGFGEFFQIIRYVVNELDPQRIHAYLSNGVGGKSTAIPIVEGTPTWNDKTLQRLDCLVLDLGDLQIGEQYHLDQDDIPYASADELMTLNVAYPGAAFYIKERLSLLAGCQLVQILSQYDSLLGTTGGGAMETDLRVLDKYLNPFCDDQRFDLRDGPWTYRHPKTTTDAEQICERIGAAYRNHTDGYAGINQGAVEFAADHDEPVLLLGESGTGKGVLARRIHRRWTQQAIERRRSEAPPSLFDMVEVNCPALSRELARSELFGHVRGAYTGAESFSFGRLLPACLGLDLEKAERRRRSDPIHEFRDALLAAAGGRLEEASEGGLRLRSALDEPICTLFLDEFADLPPEVGAAMLRFLQDGEVHPVGYPVPIEGLRYRVIAATSDPFLAARAGESTLGGGRRGEGQATAAFREDLLSRVYGQVIRAEPVGPNKERIRAQLDRFVRMNAKSEWTTAAKDALVEGIHKVIGEQDRLQPDKHPPVPAFGHYRDLRRITRLADAYVAGARRRGIRIDDGDGVTASVVARVWRQPQVDFINGPFSRDTEDAHLDSAARELRSALELHLKTIDVDVAGLWTRKPLRRLRDILETLIPNRVDDVLKTIAIVYAADTATRKTLFDLNNNGQVTSWYSVLRNKMRDEGVPEEGTDRTQFESWAQEWLIRASKNPAV